MVPLKLSEEDKFAHLPLGIGTIVPHPEKILQYYSCIGGYLVAQNTVFEIWSNAW